MTDVLTLILLLVCFVSGYGWGAYGARKHRKDHEAMEALRGRKVDVVAYTPGEGSGAWCAYRYGSDHLKQSEASESNNPAEAIRKAVAAQDREGDRPYRR